MERSASMSGEGACRARMFDHGLLRPDRLSEENLRMNKKLTALAVAGALAAPAAAFAQASNVTIYGRANLGLDPSAATGATAGSAFDYKSRNRVYDAGSRLGFNGTEDLGGGLKAIFLMESGVNIDTGGATGQSGSPNPNSGLLSSRVGQQHDRAARGQLHRGRRAAVQRPARPRHAGRCRAPEQHAAVQRGDGRQSDSDQLLARWRIAGCWSERRRQAVGGDPAGPVGAVRGRI